MNKLYKIIMTHYAPKDRVSAIKEYIVATSDRDAFEYLANGYAYWKDILEDYDDNGEDYCKEEYEEILRNKGDEREVYDLYYGATQYSWEEVELLGNDSDKEIFIEDVIQNGLAKKIEKFKEEI